MSVLNHLALFAAMLLLIELIVLILVLLGVAGGLAFGLRWVRGKVGWASEKGNHYLGRGAHFVDLGLNYVALPVIRVSGFVEMVKATAVAIRERVRTLEFGRRTVLEPYPHMLAEGGPPEPQPAALPEPARVLEPEPHMLAHEDTEIKPLPR